MSTYYTFPKDLLIQAFYSSNKESSDGSPLCTALINDIIFSSEGLTETPERYVCISDKVAKNVLKESDIPSDSKICPIVKIVPSVSDYLDTDDPAKLVEYASTMFLAVAELHKRGFVAGEITLDSFSLVGKDKASKEIVFNELPYAGPAGTVARHYGFPYASPSAVNHPEEPATFEDDLWATGISVVELFGNLGLITPKSSIDVSKSLLSNLAVLILNGKASRIEDYLSKEVEMEDDLMEGLLESLEEQGIKTEGSKKPLSLDQTSNKIADLVALPITASKSKKKKKAAVSNAAIVAVLKSVFMAKPKKKTYTKAISELLEDKYSQAKEADTFLGEMIKGMRIELEGEDKGLVDAAISMIFGDLVSDDIVAEVKVDEVAPLATIAGYLNKLIAQEDEEEEEEEE